MSRFAILLDGDLWPTARLRRQIAGARVIAADGGIRHAASLGVSPELWIGDFDSSDEVLVQRHAGVVRESYLPEKAATDGELAVEAAIARGATELVLCGALGGARTDHALFQLVFASALAARGLDVLLTSGREEAVPLGPALRSFDIPTGVGFSIIGLSALGGVTIRGAKWPLDSVDVPFGSSLTISNVCTGGLVISIANGTGLLVVHSADLTGSA